MGTTRVIKIGRQELYERVWSIPMMTACRDYGISNVGLAKVCKRHKIPCPPRGYWAKMHSGPSVRRTQLPASPDPTLQTVEIHPPPPKPAERAVEFDPDITALLDKVRGLPPITVPAALHNPHLLVRAPRTGLDGAQPDTHNLVHPAWNGEPALAVAVGSGSVRRALRLLDTLVKAVERLGGRVEVRTRERDWKRETVAEFCGETVGLLLRERYRQVPTPPGKRDSVFGSRVGYVPTGELVLDRGPDDFDHPCGQDTTAAGGVEDQIGEILLKLVSEAGKVRIRRREREAEHRRWEEQERLRREQVERERVERARVEALLTEAVAWRRANDLRAYIAAVEKRAAGGGQPADATPELAEWLTWAREQADRLDPVSSTLGRLTGTNVAAKGDPRMG